MDKILGKWKQNYELYSRAITIAVGLILFLMLLVINFIVSPSVNTFEIGYGLIAVIFLAVLEYFYFRKSQWLSYLVQKELKSILTKEGYYWKNLFRKYMLNPFLDYWIFITSIIGLIIFGLVISIIITTIISDENRVWFWSNRINVEFINNAIQLIATVFTICIAVIVFAAESIQKNLPKFSFLYFKKTKIVHVIFIGIVSIAALFSLYFNWNAFEGQLSFWASISVYSLVVLNIGLIGLLLINIIRGQQNYLELVVEHIESEIRNSVYSDVLERVRTNEFYKQLEGYDISPHLSDRSADFSIKASKSGVVTDINIGKLNRLNNRLKFANVNTKLAVIGVGYEVEKDKDTVITISGNTPVNKSSNAFVKIKNKLSRKAAGYQAIRKLVIDAIKDEDDIQTERLSDLYINLSNSYMDELYKIGFRFDKKQAAEFGWLKLYFHDYLRDDFEEFVRQAAKTGNTDLIRTVIYKARVIMVDAIQKRNLLLFSNIGYLFPRLYWLTKHVEGSDKIRELIRYEACSWSKESIKLHLQIELSKSNDIEDIANLGMFVEKSTEIYSTIAKAALEESDKNNLEIINTHLDNLLKDGSDMPSYAPDEARIKEYLEKGTISASDAEKYRIDRAKADISEKFILYKKKMWYGLGGWTIHLLLNGKLQADDINRGNLIFILHKYDVETINKIFDDINGDFDSDEKREFNWSSWTLERHEPGIVYSMWAENEWLNSFFVLWVLTQIRNGNDNNHLIRPGKGIKRDKSLPSIANNFTARKEIWDALLTNTTDKVTEFHKVYEESKKTQAKVESDWLINQPLSQTKIDEFTADIKQSHKQEAVMRQIFNTNGSFLDLTSEDTTEQNIYYVSKFLEKAMFVEEWDTSYSGFAESFGGGLATSENHLTLAPMQSNSTKIVPPEGSNILQVIDLLIKELSDNGTTPQVIFVPLLKYDEQQVLTNSEDFTSKENVTDFDDYKSFDAFRGLYKNIPVFQLNNVLLNKAVLVANISNFGKFKQLKIKDLTGQTFEFVYELVTGEKLEKEATRDIWATDEDGKQLTPEQIKERIQKYIIVGVSEKFAIEMENGAAVASSIYPNALGR